jgi:hypothetical protein
MWFRQLIVSAVCAALAGLAASSLVRAHLSAVISALAQPASQETSSQSPVQDEGSVEATVGLAPQGGTSETLTATVLPARAAKRRSAHPAAPHKPARETFSLELARGIRKLAEHRYDIKRQTLDLALGNFGLLARSVLAAPEVRDGRPMGFRLFAIKADGPFAKLGLQNDDVLVSISGLDLATPEHALDAYGKLKTARHLVLGLVRNGQPTTLEYTIR